jgi:hypothetical protein
MRAAYAASSPVQPVKEVSLGASAASVAEPGSGPVSGRLSVRVRLLATFAALIALMTILVVVAVAAVNDLRAAQHEVSDKAVPYLQGLSDAALAAKAAANDERGSC